MKREQVCKHCHGFFEARRSNHLYCSASCKTKASYKRNDYKYISGHYQKTNALVESEGLSMPVNTTIVETMKILENNLLYNFLSVQNPKKHISTQIPHLSHIKNTYLQINTKTTLYNTSESISTSIVFLLSCI